MHDLIIEKISRPFSTWMARPGFGENSLGYFSRLVAEAGHVSLRVYAREIGLNGRNLDPQEFLAPLSRLPLECTEIAALTRATATASRSDIHLAGSLLWPKWHWRMNRRRYCPACLAENAHHRTWWDILSYRVCHLHGLAIEDRDPHGRLIDWWWPSYDIGPSGASLARRAPVAPETPAYEGFLVGRLGYAPPIPAPMLDEIPLSNAIEAVSFVGRLLCWDGEGKHPPAPGVGTFKAGFEACRNDFDHLAGSISDWLVDTIPEERRKLGLEPTFEWAYRHRHPRRDGCSLVPVISDAMKAALARNGRLGRKATNARQVEHEELLLMELATRYGLTRNAMWKLLEFEGIQPREVAGRTALFFDAEAVRRLDLTVDSLIHGSEVTEITGLGPQAINRLADAGLLPRLRGIGAGKARRARFRRTDVERLLADAMEKRADKAFDDEIQFTFFAQKSHVEQGDLAVMVMKGEITPSLRTGSKIGFRSFRFSKADLAPFIAEAPVAPAADEPGVVEGVTQVDAEVITGFSRETLFRFEELGMLKRVAGHAYRGVDPYDSDMVQRLADTYAPATLYCGVLSTSERKVVDRLADHGVLPFTRARHHTHETTTFERARVREALGLEHDPDRVPGDRILALWSALSEAVRSLGKLSKIPPRLQSERFYFNDASFMSSFEVMVDRDCHTIWLTMRCDPEKSPRRWDWLQRNRAAVEAAMPTLKPMGTGGAIGTFRVASTADVKVTAVAIDALTRLR